ncbi:hypothetical protein FA10DRAFT_302475 [Acaromyces ingoldii]|uniref:Zn(2)-C6 fungal-type domain-containing protein n=1 Tax=Acaromyces ingoldii TaxID=215250 RepID=A0A316YJ55_9BASI|nr:hypothetical protein FA10DRAFT_302475 [Acaromyces ingoldii]PWN89096.1 hypothetical protein FA10DRAFT_302475 [Acaromyces ingoldii]
MTEQRRSCTFCRQRKMRCSGTVPWCQACSERGMPCVYETVKVRTCRPSVNDTSCSEPVDPNILLSQSSACFVPQSKGQQQETLGDVLAKSFVDFWEGRGRGKLAASNIYGSRQEKKEMKKRQRPFKGCLLDVIEDHVRLTARSISQLDDGGGEAPAFSVICALDVGKHDFHTLPKMRASTASSNMGAKALRQIHLQLVELAFAEHPILPLVVSKTSFMQQHRQESLEPWIFDLVLTEGLARLSRSQR